MEVVVKKFIINTYSWFKNKLKNDQLDAFSAQSAFFVVIAVIPFIIFTLSFFNAFNISGSLVLDQTLSLLPKEIYLFISDLISIQYQPVGIISAAGFACLWSSSKATLALIKGLNSVFEIEEERSYFKLRFLSILYTFVFTAMLLATVIILVFGNTLYNLFIKNLLPFFSMSIFDYKHLLAFIILSGFFCLTYKFLPRNNNTPLRCCLIGSFLSSVGWMIFSFFFAIFVENYANYSDIYGSLTTVIVFMLWLYICMYIMLLGAEISLWIHKTSPNLKKFF